MKKRALISAIAMLVVSAIVLTSATFAWFSMGKKVTVEQFKANVSEADGLLISAYADKDFDTSVSLKAIRTAADADLNIPGEEAKISPVSFNVNGTFIAGYLDDQGDLQTSVAADGSYYKIPLYIKYYGTETATIALDGTTVSQGTGTKGTNAFKAVRVATDKASYVFAPNSETSETFQYVATAGGAAQTLSNVVTQADSNNLTFTLNPGSTTKVIVYVWLEGTDPQCTDDEAAGGDFTVDLAFVKR